MNGVQFGATRVHNDVRFHWGSIAASRDVAFSEKTTPVVTHRKGYTQTITDIASSTRLEAFAALASRHTNDTFHFSAWRLLCDDLTNECNAVIPGTATLAYEGSSSSFVEAFAPLWVVRK